MQSAATVLDVLRERGKRGLPLERLYRQMFNPQLYLLAYGRIYANKGAMTRGVTQETVDGMSMRKIGRIIEAIRFERYRFHPVRRVRIPKKSGKGARPLGLPTWSDKLVGEVVRLLLEAYYEPQFSDRSHGFRPGRGCHTALREVFSTWTGTSWFVEGDVANCFGSLDHEVLLSTLAESIHDNRFLRLMRNMLTAGFLEDWVWNATLSGAPQGGTASPILSNVYLHRLDRFVETVLIPEYTRGGVRRHNREYLRTQHQLQIARQRGDRAGARKLLKRLHSLPSRDLSDPGYRRLRYIRYADDTLLGFAGPKAEAEQIKQRLAQFLHGELKLTLSQDKTLVTHARSGAARFLGYEISTGREPRRRRKRTTPRRRPHVRHGSSVAISLRVPKAAIEAKIARYLARGEPACRNSIVNDDDYSIVAKFGAEYRGFVQYYLLAGDVYRLHRLRWVMETSMLKTLARKHNSTVTKTAVKYKAKVQTPKGIRTCFEATLEREGKKPLVARFGGIALQRQHKAILIDRLQPHGYPQRELVTRLRAGRCEICQQAEGVQVHHVRKLADLVQASPQPLWVQLMARKRRKSLVVCALCHGQIHSGGC